MADETFTTNLDLNARDNASSVIKSAAERVRDSLKQYERSVRDVAKAEKDASSDATKYFQLKKEQMDAWARLQSAQSSKMAEDIVKLRRKEEEHRDSIKKTGQEAVSAYGAASNALVAYAGRFVSVAAAADGVRRSFLAFGEHQRQLTTMRTDMRLNSEQTAAWAAQMQKLSAQTGLTNEQLTQSFARFRSQNKLGFEEAIKLHEQLAQAAANSGTAIEDWEKIGATATRSMKGNVQGVIDGWRSTIPAQMVGPFADGLAKITSNIKKAGGEIGPEFAHQLGGAFKATEGMLETPQKGAQGLVDLLAAATDNSTNFGKVMEADYKKMMAREIDLVQFLANAQKAAEGQLVNAPGRTGESARARMGLTEDAAKVLKLDLKQVGEEADRSKSKIGGIAKETADLAGTPAAAVNRLTASYEGLKVSAGATVDAIGGTVALNALSTSLDMWTKIAAQATIFGKSVPLITPAQIGSAAARAIMQGAPTPQSMEEKGAPKGMPWQGRTRRPATFNERFGFATGGEFVVPGSGGTDTTPVDIMATPGEKVSIDPQGGRQESLKVQQDKADQAMREHFARFHRSDRQRQASLAGDLGGMYDSKGRYTGKGGPGGGGAGAPMGGSGPPGSSGGGGGDGTPGGGGGDGKVSPTAATSTSPAGTTAATLPGSVASLGYEPGKFTPVQDLTTASGAAAAPAGATNPYLAQARAPYFAEMDKDPKLRTLVMQVMKSEMGGRGKGASGVLEAMVDRARMAGQKSLKQAIYSGFYGPVNKHQLTAVTAKERADAEAMIERVRGGSRDIGLRTDQGQQWEHWADKAKRIEREGKVEIGGEWFSYHNKKWSMEEMRKADESIRKAPGADQPALKMAQLKAADPDLPPSLLDPNQTKLPITAGGGPPAGDIRLGEKGAHGYTRGGVTTEAWLIDTVRQASKALPEGYRAEVISTVDPRKTGTKWHPGGRAIDIQIYDKDNKPVINVGKKEGSHEYAVYERMALAARQYAAQKYPDKQFIWGGHFNSGTAYDLMHFQSGGVSARGFSKQQLATPVIITPDGKTQVAGPGGAPGTTPIKILRVKPTDPTAGGPDDTPLLGGKAAGKGPRGRTFSQEARHIRRLPYVAPAGEGRASGKGTAQKTVTVRPVSPEGHEDTAAGKGVAPAPEPAPAPDPEGKQYGGNVYEGQEYTVGEEGEETFVPGQGGYVNPKRDRWPHMPTSKNFEDRTKEKGGISGKMSDYLREQAEAQAGALRYWSRLGMGGGLTEQLGGGALDPLRSKSGGIGDYNMQDPKQNQDPSWPKYPMMIEPIIKPRVQNMGPASMRWTRHAERNRDQDNTRRAAREAHTDLGFQS